MELEYQIVQTQIIPQLFKIHSSWILSNYVKLSPPTHSWARVQTHVEPIPRWPRNGLAVPRPCKPGRAQVMIRPCSVCLAEDTRCGHGSPVSTTQKWMMKHWKLPKYCGLFETHFLIDAGVTWDPLVAKDEIDSWGDKPWTFNSKLDI